MLCAAKRENSASSFVEIICETEIAGLVYGVLLKIICETRKYLPTQWNTMLRLVETVIQWAELNQHWKILFILQPRYMLCEDINTLWESAENTVEGRIYRENCEQWRHEAYFIVVWAQFGVYIFSHENFPFSRLPHISITCRIDFSISTF